MKSRFLLLVLLVLAVGPVAAQWAPLAPGATVPAAVVDVQMVAECARVEPGGIPSWAACQLSGYYAGSGSCPAPGTTFSVAVATGTLIVPVVECYWLDTSAVTAPTTWDQTMVQGAAFVPPTEALPADGVGGWFVTVGSALAACLGVVAGKMR